MDLSRNRSNVAVRMATTSRRQRLLEGSLQQRRNERPATGDLFVAEITAKLPVQWLILDADEAGRVLAVPADTNPVMGSGDIAVFESTTGARLNLRCRTAEWVAASLFDARLRSGTLNEADLEAAAEAYRKARAATAVTAAGSAALGVEVEPDPEYDDWLTTVVRPAIEKLRESDAAATNRLFRYGGMGRQKMLKLAASLIAVISLALVGSLFWQTLSRQDHTRPARPQLFTELAVPNLPVIRLSPRETQRASAQPRSLGQAPSIALVLLVDPTRLSEVYRLEIRSVESETLIYASDELLRDGGTVSIGLPSALFEEREYRISLLGLENGQVGQATEYDLTIRK